jgi:hypothetical protein
MKRHVVGGRRPKAKSLRDAQFRAALVSYLGMHPEDPTTRAGRYAATTGELLGWVKEKHQAKKGRAA